MATLAETVRVPPGPVGADAFTVLGRCRTFLWLWSGLFSAASLAVPAVGFVAYGRVEGMSANFLASILSACLFGLASFLHFGPESA